MAAFVGDYDFLFAFHFGFVRTCARRIDFNLFVDWPAFCVGCSAFVFFFGFVRACARRIDFSLYVGWPAFCVDCSAFVLYFGFARTGARRITTVLTERQS